MRFTISFIIATLLLAQANKRGLLTLLTNTTSRVEQVLSIIEGGTNAR